MPFSDHLPPLFPHFKHIIIYVTTFLQQQQQITIGKRQPEQLLNNICNAYSAFSST